MTFRPLVVQSLPKRDVPVAVSSQPVQNRSVTTLFGQDAFPSQSTGLPNPLGKLPLNTGWSSGFNINLEGVGPPAPPKTCYDYPNPRGPRGLIADQLGYIDGSEYWMLNGAKPSNQIDWPNPTLRTVQRQDFPRGSDFALFTFVPPVVIPPTTQKYFFADVGTLMGH